jgi:hypothetical protein
MPTIRFGLDQETYDALIDEAERHLRPADRHAAALLRQALGLPFPLPSPVGPQPMASVTPGEGRCE